MTTWFEMGARAAGRLCREETLSLNALFQRRGFAGFGVIHELPAYTLGVRTLELLKERLPRLGLTMT
jgi:hypothetical protein